MIRVISYEQIDRGEWSALVQTSATGTWFQTPEAYEFLLSQPELFKPFVFGIENEGQLRGVCCGYVTVEKSALKQFLTRRAIIIGGPCLADDASNEEVEALMSAVRELASLRLPPKGRREKNPSLQGRAGLGYYPIYIETRNFNDYSKWRSAFASAGFEYVPHLNFHVDTSSVEVVEANLGKSRKRDIRTTIREGVTILSVNEPLHSMSRADALNEPHYVLNDEEKEKLMHEYYLILKNLYETKVKTPLFPESFFQALAKHSDGRILLTMKEGKVIGGTVCVVFDKELKSEGIKELKNSGVMYEWFVCGEDGVYPHVFPSCYATYAGIRYAADHNIPRFDMMGAGKPDEAYGVRDFKAKFGGKEVEHGRFLCVTKPLLYRIGVLGVKLLKRFK